MFKQIVILVISGAFSATAMSAVQSPKESDQIVHALTPQQQKMKSCNFEAKNKNISGDERKHFMGECLSAKKESSVHRDLTPQQNKMKDCNLKASQQKLSDDVRRNFMSNCLKNSNH